MADNPAGQSCGTCVYFKDGMCRLNPPAPRIVQQRGGGTEERSVFPAVDPSDWCGAWKAPAE